MIIANTFKAISQASHVLECLIASSPEEGTMAKGFVSKMPFGAVSICMPISRRSLIGRLNVSSNPEFKFDGGKKKLDRSSF